MTVPFRILYVCIGNACRSVFAERLTRLELDRQPAISARRFQVSSAGTRGRDGAPMHPYTARLLPVWDADPTGFASRRLTAAMLREADLVLTATARERDDALGLLPGALRRTFTINEFARLGLGLGDLHDIDPEPAARGRLVVAAALSARGRVPVDAPAPDGEPLPDDIVDPERTVEAFRECGLRVERAVRLVVSALLTAAPVAAISDAG